MSFALTSRQRELLVYLRERETCPSFDEMRDALGLSNKSQVSQLVKALEERGFIRRLVNRVRSIELTDKGLGGASAKPATPPMPPVVWLPIFMRDEIRWHEAST